MNTIKTHLNTIIISLIVSGTVLLNACTDEGETSFTEAETSGYESAETLEESFDVIEAITIAGIEYAESEHSGRTTVDAEIVCAKLTLSGTIEDGRLEINFGNQGCEGPDGRIRKGTVIIEWMGKRFQKGSKITTLLKDFHIGDYKLEGTRLVTNVSESLTNPVFDIEVTNGKLTWADSTYATWQAARTQNWTIENDKVTLSITGSTNGLTKAGSEYTTEITEPLIIESSCLAQRNYLPSKGNKLISLKNANDVNVNYGDGTCDQVFTVSIGTYSKEVHF